MSTMSYYEQYRTLSARCAEIEGLIQFSDCSDFEQLCAELDVLRRRMLAIENDLARYIPFDLPPRLHYRALEEREFLFYRCVKGLTLMRTAELLNVSRDTVYRIKRRLSAADGAFFSAYDAI